jgi:hypothetical protein
VSVAGDQVDAFEALALAAVAGLTSSQKPKPSTKLPTSSLPHLFLHTRQGVSSIVEHGQRGRTRAVVAEFIFRDTLANAEAAFELVQAALDADQTLGQTVDSSDISSWTFIEHHESTQVIIEAVISFQTVEP